MAQLMKYTLTLGNDNDLDIRLKTVMEDITVIKKYSDVSTVTENHCLFRHRWVDRYAIVCCDEEDKLLCIIEVDAKLMDASNSACLKGISFAAAIPDISKIHIVQNFVYELPKDDQTGSPGYIIGWDRRFYADTNMLNRCTYDAHKLGLTMMNYMVVAVDDVNLPPAYFPVRTIFEKILVAQNTRSIEENILDAKLPDEILIPIGMSKTEANQWIDEKYGPNRNLEYTYVSRTIL